MSSCSKFDLLYQSCGAVKKAASRQDSVCVELLIPGDDSLKNSEGQE